MQKDVVSENQPLCILYRTIESHLSYWWDLQQV